MAQEINFLYFATEKEIAQFKIDDFNTRKKRGKKIYYIDTQQWDPGINYRAGDIVKHGGFIFEAIVGNIDSEPFWPRPRNNPWKLKVLI